MTARDDRLPALAAGIAMTCMSCLLVLADAGLLAFDWGWTRPMACLAVGSALLAIAGHHRGTAYAGVLTRLAEQRGWPLWALRSATVATAPLAGAGVAAYAGVALAQVLSDEGAPDSRVDWRRCVGTGMLGLGFVLACLELGASAGSETLLWSVLLAGSGLSLFWWLPEGILLAGRAEEQDLMLRFHLSLLLTIGSIVYLLDTPGLFSDAVEGNGGPWDTVAATAAVIAIPLLVFGPRWLRTTRALTHQRIALARVNERAELAGRVHDEVMQTLALIQDRADDPADVRRLARRQERDLRSWLLAKEPATAPSHSIASALRAAAAEIEDSHGVEIDVVTVGDAPLDERTRGLVLAAREALTNAAKYAANDPISLFLEVDGRHRAAYVRDRGPGFDLDAIPSDRHGVRDSIIARMERHGGDATIRTAPGGGCEVQLVQESRR